MNKTRIGRQYLLLIQPEKTRKNTHKFFGITCAIFSAHKELLNFLWPAVARREDLRN